jgi:phosphatidate cytidylyltransferase
LNNLFQRTISGIIYLIVIIGSLLLGEYAFGALFLAVSVLAIAEYLHINRFRFDDLISITGIVSGAITFLTAFLYASGFIESKYLAVLVIIPVAIMILGLYIRKDAVQKINILMAGLLYISLPLAMTNLILFPEANGYFYTHRLFLGILILIWLNDTGAYVSGMLFGKNKLFPRISPKKSWEGFVGGTLATIISGFLMPGLMQILDKTDWIVLAIIVSVFGVLGDLVESLLKRNMQVKDSGSIIPGHGGILDRFDSMLFAVPAAVAYLMIRG